MICKGKEGKWELASSLVSCVSLVTSVTAGKLWQLASYVAVGKLWQLAICTSLVSCMAGNELHTVGRLCGSGQSVAKGKLCGRGQAM